MLSLIDKYVWVLHWKNGSLSAKGLILKRILQKRVHIIAVNNMNLTYMKDKLGKN